MDRKDLILAQSRVLFAQEQVRIAQENLKDASRDAEVTLLELQYALEDLS